MTAVKIKDLAIYHPSHYKTNEYYFNHFDQKGKDIRRLLEHVGREKRYLIEEHNEEETGLTMAIKSSLKVLEKTKLSGKDIDMIIFCTQTPEQMVPMNAFYIHQAIEASSKTRIFDMNANCAGMALATEFASKYMLADDKIQRTLIVGTDQFSPILNPEDEVTYPYFGDISVAMILEKTEEAIGLIDSDFVSDSSNPNTILFPVNGLRALIQKGIGEKMQLTPFDDTAMFNDVYASIRNLLNDNGLKPEQVKCCFSQNSLANIKKIQEEIGLKEENVIFVADQFGYSGTTSPFLALHEGIKDGRIKRNDYILFWSIGTGYQFITMLYKY